METTTSRRTVAKGVAWSVPAVVIGAAAPAVAASCPPDDRTATVSGESSSMTSTANEIVWTNNGPDIIPAGTTWTAYVYVQGTMTASGRVSYSYPDATHNVSVTVTPLSATSSLTTQVTGTNPVVNTVSAPHGYTQITVTLNDDFNPGDTFTSSWSTTSQAVTVAAAAAAKSQGIAHPMGSGSSASRVTTVGYLPTDENSVQNSTTDAGCSVTTNLTVSAFNTSYGS